ncbi:MAG: hypothetical protein ACI9CB_002608 [Rhodothermales bacterium]|jgi:hypothetical protein
MVSAMPIRSQKLAKKERHEIPHWRRIEIMREKAELRAALGDLDSDFDEIDEEVFGSDEEYVSFHKHIDDEVEIDEVEIEELLEDDADSDGLDDFEDD